MGNQLAIQPAVRQARQQVASSNAYGLVTSEAPDEEIRRSLTVEDRASLPTARWGLEQALRTADRDDQEAIAMQLGRQIGLMRPNLVEVQKEEWIALALDELSDLPAELVLEALPLVRRSAKFEGEVVPGVIEYVEPRASRLRAELRCFEKLTEVAG